MLGALQAMKQRIGELPVGLEPAVGLLEYETRRIIAALRAPELRKLLRMRTQSRALSRNPPRTSLSRMRSAGQPE